MKYSDQVVEWLLEEGYTHCFFLAGGNIMHLLDSVRSRMTCIPFVNEIGAAIAAEYFVATRPPGTGKAFVLVTAGPGLTNTITAIASAWAESRELLVIGGQVKKSDLSKNEVRQRGIQELDGIALTNPICKSTLKIEEPVSKEVFLETVRDGATDRKGPVFIEICLDAQGAPAIAENNRLEIEDKKPTQEPSAEKLSKLVKLIESSQRPVLLLGSGLSRVKVHELNEQIQKLGIPLMCSYNAADYISSTHPLYAGRPNTWGQRYSNIAIQQADVVVALGARLGLQQTGFAWEEFVPKGKLVHVDIDKSELDKGHPYVDLKIQGDATLTLEHIIESINNKKEWPEWMAFINELKVLLPISEKSNTHSLDTVDPYDFYSTIASQASEGDILVPCSSGGAFTVALQAIEQVKNQRIITNKSVASMGYGLSGAIGASIANPSKTTFLVEGDGGFAQNIQELGTAAINNLPLKIFVFSNHGYASIRMTQRNYFGGAWVGCDIETGVGLPNLQKLADTYNIPYVKMTSKVWQDELLQRVLKLSGPALIEVPVDPEQTYFPKIMSTVQPDGTMRSNPIHLMHPPLSLEVSKKAFRFSPELSNYEELRNE